MRLRNLGACILALVMVACGGKTETMNPETEGRIELPLISSADGKDYKLVGATFTLTGPQTVTVTDTSADTVEQTLLAGSYTVQVGGDWHMESVADGTTIPAQLISPNPLPFLVTKGQTTHVRFIFKLPGSGTANVGIQTDSGGWLAGTLHFATPDAGAPTGPFAELKGKSVPFVISYASSVVNKDSWSKELTVETDNSVTVQFGGPRSALLEQIAASFKDNALIFNLRAEPDGNLRFSYMFFRGGSDAYALELLPSPFFPGEVDADGYPAQQPFEFETSFRLSKPGTPHELHGTVSVNGAF